MGLSAVRALREPGRSSLLCVGSRALRADPGSGPLAGRLGCRREKVVFAVWMFTTSKRRESLERPGSRASAALRALWLCVCGLGLAGTAADAGLPPPAVPASALGRDAIDQGEPVVEARLLIDAESIRPGDSVRVGVLLDFAPHWHMYWRSPGESGLPTSVDWEVDGGTVGPPEWPAPGMFREADGFLTTYGWDDQVLLMAPMTVAADQVQDGVLGVQVEGVVCKIRCIPAQFTLERPIPVAPATRPADPKTRALFAAATAKVPRAPGELGVRVEALYSQSAIRPDDTFAGALVVTSCEEGQEGCFRAVAPPADGVSFVPDRTESVELEVGSLAPHPRAGSVDGFVVELSGRADENDPGTHQRLRGVLALAREGGGEPSFVEIDLPLPRARAHEDVVALPESWASGASRAGDAAAAGSGGSPGVLEVLLLALLGGLILNAMPCVLPVLAIKVFSVAELAQQSRRAVLRHGAAYGAGVLLSMLGLAAVVVALKAAGTELGWGFQFQEPVFIAAISAVLVAFALNLFGVFEVSVDTGSLAQIGAGRSGPGRSFFDGLLAVVLATPCSAPFLGTAVGFAFASPPVLVFAVFAAIGLGLASPYLLVSAVPGWGRFLPKPGAWMAVVRALLGFALLGTVVWLAWLMSRSAGPGAQVVLLAFLLFVAFLSWLYGSVQRREGTGIRRAVGYGALAASLGVLVLLPLESRPAEAAAEERASGTVAYDAAEIASQLEKGRPVFAYFTADWCITCKVNEQFVLADERVREAIEDLDVAVFRGDWTRRDEGIRAELARFGRAGVPVYVVYGPGRPTDPEVLPELLTVEMLLAHLRAAAAS